MNKLIRPMIIQSARAGFPMLSLNLHIQYDSRFSKDDCSSFCKWAIENEPFYDWLRKRLCKTKMYF